MPVGGNGRAEDPGRLEAHPETEIKIKRNGVAVPVLGWQDSIILAARLNFYVILCQVRKEGAKLRWGGTVWMC